MEITEEGRHRMYSRLEAMMGHDDATMLMEHLPPVGWGEVATTRDVALLRGELEHVERSLRSELAVLRSELRADLAQTETRVMRAIVVGIIASNVTIAGLAFAAAGLT